VRNAIARCRTAALGWHRDQCVCCGHQVISYHSCRNRHCPKCQINTREKWLAKRRRELLPVEYYHVVFSVPHRLVPLIWQNRKLPFSLPFKSVSATLLEIASNPKNLGAQIGFLSILTNSDISEKTLTSNAVSWANVLSMIAAVSGTMLFADFSQVILAFWGNAGADILVNPYADSVYTKGNVLIRAFVDADVLIRHPEGFCFCDGITL
jgi:hypothetical protein